MSKLILVITLSQFLIHCNSQSKKNNQSAPEPVANAAPAVPTFFKPERVRFPANYKENLKEFAAVDRYDNKEIRRMYAEPKLLSGNYLKSELPVGSSIVMVHEKPKMDANGNFERDANGRFVSTGEVTKISVMEKGKDWGTQYPDYLRNGEWEYAVYSPNGQLKAGTDYTKCMNCHTSREARDFNFSLYEANLQLVNNSKPIKTKR